MMVDTMIMATEIAGGQDPVVVVVWALADTMYYSSSTHFRTPLTLHFKDERPKAWNDQNVKFYGGMHNHFHRRSGGHSMEGPYVDPRWEEHVRRSCRTSYLSNSERRMLGNCQPRYSSFCGYQRTRPWY